MHLKHKYKMDFNVFVKKFQNITLKIIKKILKKIFQKNFPQFIHKLIISIEYKDFFEEKKF